MNLDDSFMVCLDHDHDTGKIRGFLCHHCNRALGAFGDNLEGVMRIVAYLQQPPSAFAYEGVDEPYVREEVEVEKM